jgi:hypothetical protein
MEAGSVRATWPVETDSRQPFQGFVERQLDEAKRRGATPVTFGCGD